jgi:hypothetical protein
MAKVFKLPEDEYQVQGADGTTKLTAPLLELYYLIAQATETPGLPEEQKFDYAAMKVNEKYGSKLDGGQLLSIFIDLSESVEESKKNTTSTQE